MHFVREMKCTVTANTYILYILCDFYVFRINSYDPNNKPTFSGQTNIK